MERRKTMQAIACALSGLAALLILPQVSSYGPWLAAGAALGLTFFLARPVWTSASKHIAFRDVLLVMAASFSYALSFALLLEGLPQVSGDLLSAMEEPVMTLLNDMTPADLVLTYAVLPLAEEAVFRSGLQRLLRKRISALGTIALSVLIYALGMGLSRGKYAALYAIISGLVLAVVEETYGSLWLNWAAHLSFQLGALMTILGMFLSTTALLVLAAVSLLVSMLLFRVMLQGFEEEEGED
jgi:membrane protease YdiL (CAAX protease family)